MADMDEFAQTRGDDDLFDDEIIPVSAEEQQAQTEVISEPEPVPQEETAVIEKQPPSRGHTPQRGRGGDRGRGRGRGRGKGGRGLQDSKFADPEQAESPRNKRAAKTPEPDATRDTHTSTPDQPQEEVKEQIGQDEEGKDILVANGAEPQRVPAVKGDRSATGGVRKPKLTEEELTKRIAAAKENAAKKAAAYARAEADQASFLEREQLAAQKRRKELANRRVMDNEREQNRQRKLKAQTGREWDSEKREEDYNPRGAGSQYRRGMHGGVSGYTRRDFDGVDETAVGGDAGPTSPRGRGRGGRGRGRGPSRGPRGEGASSKDVYTEEERKAAVPGVNDEADFPSLPAGKKPEDAPATNPTVTTADTAPGSMEKLESSFSPVSGTWADQVEQ